MAALGIHGMFFPTPYGGASTEWFMGKHAVMGSEVTTSNW